MVCAIIVQFVILKTNSNVAQSNVTSEEYLSHEVAWHVRKKKKFNLTIWTS